MKTKLSTEFTARQILRNSCWSRAKLNAVAGKQTIFTVEELVNTDKIGGVDMGTVISDIISDGEFWYLCNHIYYYKYPLIWAMVLMGLETGVINREDLRKYRGEFID